MRLAMNVIPLMNLLPSAALGKSYSIIHWTDAPNDAAVEMILRKYGYQPDNMMVYKDASGSYLIPLLENSASSNAENGSVENNGVEKTRREVPS